MACPPGMRGCSAGPSCGHRAIVDAYRQERERQEIEMEEATLGYSVSRNGKPTQELVDYLREHGPLTTFKQTLIQTKRQPEPEAPVEIGDKAEAARITAMRRAEMNALKAQEQAEDRRYAEFIEQNPEPTLAESRAYNETGLLGAAMAGDSALPALRVVRGEFSDPFHENVAAAILDQADAGLSHDAAAVTTALRERGQLPLELDPQVPLRTVDPMQYGLGSWQSNGIPYEANDLAIAVRADHRCRYLQEAGQRLAATAALAAETGTDPGEGFTRAVNELVNIPRPLDRDLQPTSAPSAENVDTEKRQPRRTYQMPTPATVTELGLPPLPVLQTTVRLGA